MRPAQSCYATNAHLHCHAPVYRFTPSQLYTEDRYRLCYLPNQISSSLTVTTNQWFIHRSTVMECSKTCSESIFAAVRMTCLHSHFARNTFHKVPSMHAAHLSQETS